MNIYYIIRILWGVLSFASMYSVAFPEQSPILHITFGIAFVLLGYIIPTPDAPEKEKHVVNVIALCAALIVFTLLIENNVDSNLYTLWHIPAFAIVATELYARIYLIARPGVKLPLLFYLPAKNNGG